MNNHCYMNEKDYGPNPFVGDIEKMAAQNPNFRTAVWTGRHLQMTLMRIPVCGEIGEEIHEETDQFIRVEQGRAMIKMGRYKEEMNLEQFVCRGEGIFVPAGTWHNVINAGKCPLRVSSIYAPPNHARGTVHRTKEEAEREEH